MNQLVLFTQPSELLDPTTEADESEMIIRFQAQRITELEREVARLTMQNKMLQEAWQNTSAENRALSKPTEYTIGQEIAFCINYGARKSWYEGKVINVGKQGIKVLYEGHYRRWVKPEFVRPIEDAPKQVSNAYIVDGEPPDQSQNTPDSIRSLPDGMPSRPNV